MKNQYVLKDLSSSSVKKWVTPILLHPVDEAVFDVVCRSIYRSTGSNTICVTHFNLRRKSVSGKFVTCKAVILLTIWKRRRYMKSKQKSRCISNYRFVMRRLLLSAPPPIAGKKQMPTYVYWDCSLHKSDAYFWIVHCNDYCNEQYTELTVLCEWFWLVNTLVMRLLNLSYIYKVKGHQMCVTKDTSAEQTASCRSGNRNFSAVRCIPIRWSTKLLHTARDIAALHSDVSV
jgi:hypothetical protein